MRTLFLMLMIALGSAPAVRAQDPLALSCTVCHGEPGRVSAVQDFRTLSATQIAEALRAYRDGARDGTAMPRLARALSDADIESLAQYFGASR